MFACVVKTYIDNIINKNDKQIITEPQPQTQPIIKPVETK